MKVMNILIVEDESIVAMEIENYIEKLGYNIVDSCSSSDEALSIISEKEVNIVLMDININGDKDGIETASALLKIHPGIQIIFLTAHTDDYNVDRAITLDPVAYLSKPFNRNELQIFLKIAAKKVNKEIALLEKNPNHIVLDHEFHYDKHNKLLYCCNEPIHLTKKELMLLDILIQNKNTIVNLYTIENELWPESVTNPNTIRTLVKRLRQKLKYKFIETISSMGYKLIITQ